MTTPRRCAMQCGYCTPGIIVGAAALLGKNDIPSAGAGETPIVAVAPALANAIFDATGRRLRSMPLIPDSLVSM